MCSEEKKYCAFLIFFYIYTHAVWSDGGLSLGAESNMADTPQYRVNKTKRAKLCRCLFVMSVMSYTQISLAVKISVVI